MGKEERDTARNRRRKSGKELRRDIQKPEGYTTEQPLIAVKRTSFGSAVSGQLVVGAKHSRFF